MHVSAAVISFLRFQRCHHWDISLPYIHPCQNICFLQHNMTLAISHMHLSCLTSEIPWWFQCLPCRSRICSLQGAWCLAQPPVISHLGCQYIPGLVFKLLLPVASSFIFTRFEASVLICQNKMPSPSCLRSKSAIFLKAMVFQATGNAVDIWYSEGLGSSTRSGL